MWILLCCYNLTLFESFFLPFEHTGREGKLGWTKDYPSSLPGSLRLGLESLIGSCSLSQSKFPVFPLDLNSLPLGSRKYLIWNLCSHKEFYLCVKGSCCWNRLQGTVWPGRDVQEQMDGCKLSSEARVRRGNRRSKNFHAFYHLKFYL